MNTNINNHNSDLPNSKNKDNYIWGQTVLKKQQAVPEKIAVRQSVIILKSKECSFTTKTMDVLNSHIKSHKVNQCDICGTIFNSDGNLKQHSLNENRDRLAQLNCNMCSFQSTSRKEFINHLLKHGESDKTGNLEIKHFKCKSCGEAFINRRSLMDHRRDNHDMPMCFFDMEDRCTQLPGKCWYKHKSSVTAEVKIIKCFTCQETFDSIGRLMEHRKNIHQESLQSSR